MLEIRARRIENIIILDLSGRIDIDSANFIEVVSQCLRDGYADILCNFEEVEFIDYMGASVIMIAYKEIINRHGRLKFVNIPAQMRKIFAITGIDKVVEISSSEELAVNSFKEDKIIENIQKMQLRRRFKRLPIDIKIELKVETTRNPACIKLDILDLSGVGAYIYGCQDFRLGDEVILRFKLPPQGDEMEIEAKVVWLADKEVQPHLYPGMGVEFSYICPTTQRKIIEFVERNLPLQPTENKDL